MPLIDHLLASARLRRTVWRFWYPFLTRRLQADDVLFLNYAFEEDPPLDLRLSSADEPNRGCIQLYHHVASLADLREREVLEVSCGHGGGASFLTRTRAPRRYTALDLNPAGIAFCCRRHELDALRFVVGDAEQLPFAAGSFDAVINVEASHCYPSFPRFLSEVTRVLRPGGALLYADFRFKSDVAAWSDAIAASGLACAATRDITSDVLRGMQRNAARSTALIQRHLPRWLHGLGRDFAGVPGSRLYNAFENGDAVYRSYLLRRLRK